MKEIIHSNSEILKTDSFVQLIGDRNKQFIIKLSTDGETETHQGNIHHNEIIGQSWGSKIKTKQGNTFLILQPSLDDLIREINRTTQIMYPKDIGYVILNLGVGPGTRVVEAGTGSGALTTVLAYLVGNEGKVYSYEAKPKHQAYAKKNLKSFGLDDRVIFKIRDIKEGFDEKNVNALFLDVQDPENYISQVRDALMAGGHFGCILPTTNQVSKLITALKRNKFEKIEVSEIFHRYYKTSATRLRPDDKMVGHTGFLLFARRTSPNPIIKN